MKHLILKSGLMLTLLCLSFLAKAELPAAVADALKRANIPLSAAAVYVQAVDRKSVV